MNFKATPKRNIFTYQGLEKSAASISSPAAVSDIAELFVQQIALVIVRSVAWDLIDVTVNIAPAAEGDHRDPGRRLVHGEVREELRHEIQLAAEIFRADRAGRVHQKHQFHLMMRAIRTKPFGRKSAKNSE